MSTVNELLADIKRRKLFVTNLYEGTDGLWRCFLRDGRNALPSRFQGTGKTMSDAMSDAIPPLTRYFYHPESDSLFTTEDGSDGRGDPLCEEIDKATFYRLKREQFGRRTNDYSHLI